MEEQQEVKISKYNSGIAQIYRLDALWKEAHTNIKLGKYLFWNNTLDTIWSELSRDLSEDDYKTKLEEFKKIDDELILLGQINDNEKAGFVDFDKSELEKRAKQYKKLREKELFLRRLENFLGKGTAWESDDEDDW